MLTSICGINWGDEGKGRMVDLLSSDYDVVCRYQGGNNAGHTVINERGKFILNLLPSGILREDVVNVLGCGMVIDLKHLTEEMGRLREAGVKITPENLKISDKAVITMPYHVRLDCLEEERLADKKFGSTRRGIAPVYSDKYMKKAFRMGELFHEELLKERVKDIVEWKNLSVVGGYRSEPVTVEETLAYFKQYGEPLKPFVTDTGLYLDKAHKEGKKIMFEAQLGALRTLAEQLKAHTETQVAQGIAAADHLKRKIVANTDAIDLTAADADKYIYMVLKSSAKSGNKYEEYMVIDGAVEKVGDWEVDLSGYAKAADVVAKEDGKGLSSNDYTDADKAKLDSLEAATDEEVAAMLAEVFGTTGTGE